MTALAQYERLESLGLWRANRTDQRREVIVSFGDATLVVSDGAGRPLSHWSLPAVARLNPQEVPAVFAPDADATETLEIDDPVMIDAIDTVRGSLVKALPRRGRLRQMLTLALLLAVIGGTALWGPDALRRQTADSVSALRRAEIGATVLGHLQARTGPVCRGTRGRAALETLMTRLFGRDAPGQIVVLPAALPGPFTLPGDLTVIDRSMLVRYDDPLIAAGDVIAARASTGDPMEALLRHAGLPATIQLLTSGKLPEAALSDYADALLAQGPRPVSEAVLLRAFADAKVSSAPYASLRSARDQNGATLITSDPMRGQTPVPVLTDAEWIQVQAICDG
ncbi:hypothetical protein SAMN05444339_105144 [Loktanella atrilutea]|uniref:Uncharacterized protein n=1 Tax=Loktanella atrilutea TaxID=366533 RepID=A0A1M5AXM3_LOKAT|nr:hypothetical protein [Loktanella atrilutea]SHF35024.1 hypothetical protein SAMN05444339_105144 [Loktanella atrilutea]